MFVFNDVAATGVSDDVLIVIYENDEDKYDAAIIKGLFFIYYWFFFAYMAREGVWACVREVL